MSPLNSTGRKILRSRAHALKPVVMVGRQGLTPRIIEKTREALDAHELIKIKFLEHKEQKQDIIQTIEESTGAECVGIIGHVAILFHSHPDEEKRRIFLPRGCQTD